MRFFIEDKEYNYSMDELEYRLISDEGTEGNVYRIQGRAVKIYKPFCIKQRLGKEMVDLLKTINTSRILMPQERVFDENKRFIGYTTELVDYRNFEIIKRMKMGLFYKELVKAEEDIRELSDRHITVEDFNLYNVLIASGIYFPDPGSYDQRTDISKRLILSDNMEQLKKFFSQSLLGYCGNLSMNSIRYLGEKFLYDSCLSEMLQYENFDEKESISHFAKKLVKKR